MSGQRATPATSASSPPRISDSISNLSLADQLSRGTVLVATSGEGDAYGAVAVAHAIARRYGSPVEAIQVLDTSAVALPAPLPSLLTMARDLIGDAPYAADVRARRHEFSELVGEPNEWPVHIAVGTPAEEILRQARQAGAPLIVMGLRRHGIVDRVLRDETTLTVARYARAAVFGVVSELRGLPRTAVVGIDFGPASVRAARAALDLLARPAAHGTGASLRLVYVDPRREAGARDDTAGEALIAKLGVKAAFELLIHMLDAPDYVRVDWTSLSGTPASELLAFADQNDADLIAVGSVHHKRLEHWTLGSVTTEVVRDGRCSVLVIPPDVDTLDAHLSVR